MSQPSLDRSPGSQVVSAVLPSHSHSRGLILHLCENLESADLKTVMVLQSAGFNVRQVDAWHYSTKRSPLADTCLLILFDINQPDGIGFRLCAQIRAQWKGPIMAILRGQASLDAVHAYEAGCDMWLHAPFYDAELVARVKVLLRGFYCASS